MSPKPQLPRIQSPSSSPISPQPVPLSSFRLLSTPYEGPCGHYALGAETQPSPTVLSFPALIFRPSRGRGLALSCLSARQFYLSITEPSALDVAARATALIPYQPASHPSRRCLSRQIHHPPICLHCLYAGMISRRRAAREREERGGVEGEKEGEKEGEGRAGGG
ncbi:hypothetical protein DPEC_G00306470 [Dallia pectoralis]|uniref:Uncharacterized protein n=1 Tax=Dallia pectoralis TaxID=75939 RepID=A0ACC2FEE5_DALPE|nr:hypothetical protein DPEC_G00306470 [Dallia pectoralis]